MRNNIQIVGAGAAKRSVIGEFPGGNGAITRGRRAALTVTSLNLLTCDIRLFKTFYVVFEILRAIPGQASFSNRFSKNL